LTLKVTTIYICGVIKLGGFLKKYVAHREDGEDRFEFNKQVELVNHLEKLTGVNYKEKISQHVRVKRRLNSIHTALGDYTVYLQEGVEYTSKNVVIGSMNSLLGLNEALSTFSEEELEDTTSIVNICEELGLDVLSPVVNQHINKFKARIKSNNSQFSEIEAIINRGTLSFRPKGASVYKHCNSVYMNVPQIKENWGGLVLEFTDHPDVKNGSDLELSYHIATQTITGRLSDKRYKFTDTLTMTNKDRGEIPSQVLASQIKKLASENEDRKKEIIDLKKENRDLRNKFPFLEKRVDKFEDMLEIVVKEYLKDEDGFVSVWEAAMERVNNDSN
jgi:hypothetical protein